MGERSALPGPIAFFREHERLLGRKVVVDRLFRHLAGGGDLGDPDLVEPPLQEHGGGGVRDHLAHHALLALAEPLCGYLRCSLLTGGHVSERREELRDGGEAGVDGHDRQRTVFL